MSKKKILLIGGGALLLYMFAKRAPAKSDTKGNGSLYGTPENPSIFGSARQAFSDIFCAIDPNCQE